MKHSKIGTDIVYQCDDGKVAWIIDKSKAYFIHREEGPIGRPFFRAWEKQLKKMKAKHGISEITFCFGDARIENGEVIIAANSDDRHKLPKQPTLEDLQKVA